MVEYSLIAAIANNFVIGNDNDIPWRIKEDWKLFKDTTQNTIVIMGKGTWNSLPKRPLPDRINIVLDRDGCSLNGAIVCNSLINAFAKAEEFGLDIFVIGGANVYSQTIDNAKYLYISHIKGDYQGNVFFPKFDVNKYKVVEEKKFDDFIFKKYQKIIN